MEQLGNPGVLGRIISKCILEGTGYERVKWIELIQNRHVPFVQVIQSITVIDNMYWGPRVEVP
jgi:hypothetical protein